MRVLIIGGTRFVGYLLAWRLLAQGEQVTLLNRGTLPDPFGDRVERLRGDRTTNLARLVAGREFDAVVDFAAFTGEDARGAVESLSGRVGHYVFISTGQVYLVKERFKLPAREEDYAGAVAPRPEDPREVPGWEYGVGKRAAEEVLEAAWQESRFPSTRIRIPMVNGERDYYRRVESYLWRLLDGGPVLLPGGGQNPCCHVYGAEVARAVAAILADSHTYGQAYNLSQEEEVPLRTLVGLLADQLGAPHRFADVAEARLAQEGLQPRDISPFSGRWMSRLDASRARRQLGFRHQPLEQYLGKMVASFLAHPPPDRPEDYRHRALELEIAAGG